jgi:pimeloyl-ACP methyl ester carboxylesterase
MSRTAIRTPGALATIVVLALLTAALTGCGVGPPSNQEKISKTTVTYLRALADGDTATACEQLMRAAKGSACEASMKERRSRLESDALKSAADDSMDIEVHAATATVGLSEPEGARFVLMSIGGDWRIDSGYTLGPTASVAISATPVGRQVAWALAQLNGGASKLSAADITRRFSPEFFAVVMPPSELVASLERTAADRRPFTFAGFAYPPTATQAVALIETKAGERGSLRIQLDRGEPARIFRFEVSEAPPVIEAVGPYSGRFDIGGRKVFLHCTGSGSPTVVFQGGLTTDWAEVQDQVAKFSRACSYDPANGLWGRSDPAPTPRTAEDVVADLHALLAAAKVPGPYVLAGHSDGGLFVQLYASKHSADVRGLVLIDAVHSDYYARRVALLKTLLPPAGLKATVQALGTRPPAIVDPEQIDVETSLAQMRAGLVHAPLHSMPLFVLTHGRSDPSGSDPRLVAADERLWQKLQDELAGLVLNSKHVIAKKSGHDIQHEQPQLVVDAIRDVVQAVRDPGSWKTP